VHVPFLALSPPPGAIKLGTVRLFMVPQQQLKKKRMTNHPIASIPNGIIQVPQTRYLNCSLQIGFEHFTNLFVLDGQSI